MNTESSWKSRPVLLHSMQPGLWFLEHFSNGKDNLNSPGSPSSLDMGTHPTPLPVLCQSQLFMQLCGEMYQGADLDGEKETWNKILGYFSSQITSAIRSIRKPHEHFCWQIAWGGREERGKAALWEVLFKQRCSWMWSHSQSTLLHRRELGFVCTVQAFISNGWAPF